MLSQKPYTHACTHITHAYTHRLWFRLAALIPLLFSPSVSALKHTSILTPVTPQSEHTHIQVHTLQWVRGKAELSHTSSHWQCVCRVCNSPTGELILLTSRVRNISSPLRPRGSAGTKVSLLHIHKDTPTNMLENTHRHTTTGNQISSDVHTLTDSDMT